MSNPEKSQLVTTTAGEIPAITNEPEAKVNNGRTSPGKKRARGRVIFHHVLCFLWLGPAITLLVLNFEEYIVGASIGCFSCRINPFSSTAFQAEAGFEKRDHTALGGLQVASKVLEAWFLVVVSGLAYDLLIMLTAKGEDFPLGLLAKYLQVSDIMSILDYPKGAEALMHYAFIIFVAFLCIMVNLMGPATAILILPNLQWRDADFRALGLFNTMGSVSPPGYTSIAPRCDAPLLAVGNYSCTSKPYADSLDELFASVATSLEQIGATEILYAPFITQERQISFVVNTTDPYVDWIPVRQVGREISANYARFGNEERDARNYTTLHNSLSTILVQDGPTIGLGGGCYRGSLSVATIAEDKSVRCYGGWNLFTDGDVSYTKCIRVGTGWEGTTNLHSRFHLGDEDSTIGDVTVDVYFADKAHTPIPSESPCFSKAGIPQSNPLCNWDDIFLQPAPLDLLTNTSNNFMLVEYHVPGLSNPTHATWCDDISYLGFGSYSLDPSPYSNFIHLTQLATDVSTVAPGTRSLVIHPDWILAGWSVDRNGTVDPTRVAARQMIRVLKAALAAEDGSDTLYLDLDTLNFLDGVVTDQGLSLMPYSITAITPTNNPQTPSSLHPLLKSGARINVWTYGLSSTTSKMGVAVVIVGSMLVILRLIVGLEGVLGPRKYTTSKGLVELLLVALDHVPQGHVPAHHFPEGYTPNGQAQGEHPVVAKVPATATATGVDRGRRMSVKVGHEGISFVQKE